jgi:hypothetical protein
MPKHFACRLQRFQQAASRHISTNLSVVYAVSLPRNKMIDPSNAKKATQPMMVTARYKAGSLLSMVIKNLLMATAIAAHARMRYQFLQESPNITLTSVCRQ